MSMTPARRLGWAGVLVLVGVAAAGAEGGCQLSPTGVCSKFAAELQLGCAKHVQLAVAYCRKAARRERFGSHEEHCQATCRAGKQAYVLDRRLREIAISNIEKFSLGNADWQSDAVAFWKAAGAAGNVCTSEQFEQAQSDCDQYCSTKARRRDLDELQALAAGKEFLELQLPVYACAPGPATRLLSGPDADVLRRLYGPGHPRRAGTAVE